MRELNYLTVQDCMWIHRQLTGEEQPWLYDRLEQATFYQYAYGQVVGIVPQSARLLAGFALNSPFPSGNEACSFISFATFVEANGYSLELSDEEALDWVKAVFSNPSEASSMVEGKLVEVEMHSKYGVPDRQEIVMGLIKRYANTCAALIAEEAPVSLG